MKTIKLEFDGTIRLGTFDTVNMVLDQLKYVEPNEQCNVIITGLSKEQSHALSSLLTTSLAWALQNSIDLSSDPEKARNNHGQGALRVSLGTAGNMDITRDETTQTTQLSLPRLPQPIPVNVAKMR